MNRFGGKLILIAGSALMALVLAVMPGQAADNWRRQSLRDQSVTGPNGVITTAEALTVNERMGADRKAVTELAPGVYGLAGWGIAISYAIDAPDGWIIIDTGDTTKAAAEMRAMLEKTVGHRIKVAAILFTHWHYTNGTAAWRDPGTEIWGSELLDAQWVMPARNYANTRFSELDQINARTSRRLQLAWTLLGRRQSRPGGGAARRRRHDVRGRPLSRTSCSLSMPPPAS